jgi:hypothetical protein
MKVQLFDKDGSIASSPVYFAYIILKVFKLRREESISIYSLGKAVKAHTTSVNLQQFFYGLMLLRMMGILEISDEIYLRINKDA